MCPYEGNFFLLIKITTCFGFLLSSVSAELTSCLALRQSGVGDSGTYTLDVDGEGGPLVGFDVYCDFSGTDATTVLHHDSEDRIGVPSGGDFHRQVTYQGSLNHIEAVVQKSASCQQFIRYECRNSSLGLAENVSWWETTTKSHVYSWGGAQGQAGHCQCGTTGKCQPSQNQFCNCDANDTVWRTDEGYLRDRTTLPVAKVSLTLREGEGYLTVGPLICVDAIEFIPNEPWQMVLGTGILVFAAFLTFIPPFVRKF